MGILRILGRRMGNGDVELLGVFPRVFRAGRGAGETDEIVVW